eukprot:TRINITY_DN19832_c0_g1_i1.p1 TRINITY_DN19832_c0_g1~~TRINITY_DN19832_c0_g1_i1.p1  ORF type:complete len:769 (-),score=195.09 TRINITY_DN19832_c0_g1_i1:1104-3410(-)
MNENFVFEEYGAELELPTQPKSPWEFSDYSQTVAEEHAKRNTTSVDHKILNKRKVSSKQVQQDSLSEHEEEVDSEETEKNSDVEDDVSDADEAKDDISTRETGHWDGNSDESAVDSVDAETKPRPTNPGKQKEKQNKRTGNEVLTSKKKGTGGFFASAEGASFRANSFAELNLSRPLLRACEALGYQKPTPIQAACIPLALTGRDICGSAITGSGKTAAFGLPVLERLLFRPKRFPATRVLILTPTRELAVQIHSMLKKLAQFTDIRCCLVVGGLSTKVQEAQLRSRPDIVVATPGRMIDHLHNSQSVGLEELAILIFDEADRLLELGFSSEIQELVKICPKRRQTMLFSATMTNEVDDLIKLSLTSPVRLSADPLTKRPSTLTEEVIKIRPGQESKQEAVLLALCSRTFPNKVIIFSGTKQEAHRLKILFGLSGLKAAELHGNLTQAQRLEALEQFRKQEVNFLIATDVAARGLDILGVQTVINFACPHDITSYVHRVGRTARAGKEGCAITFVTEKDRRILKLMAKRAGSRLLSRKVAEQSVIKWSDNIQEMEGDVEAILQEEKEERAMRKAEMEANKAQNMVEHADEIYSRPKKTWFQSNKDKKLLSKAAKELKKKDGNTDGQVTSMQEAEKLERKEKRKLDYEKNLPRKKRRRLQFERELLEENEEKQKQEQGPKSGNDQRTGKALVEHAYRRAKSAKASEKKFSNSRSTKKAPREKGRKNEMAELFKGDMRTMKKRQSVGGLRKQSKGSFKSKKRQRGLVQDF